MRGLGFPELADPDAAPAPAAAGVDASRVMMPGQSGIPDLYDWSVPATGEGGVTDDLIAAIGQVEHAVRDAEAGARGTLRKVRPATDGSLEYEELRSLGEARYDQQQRRVIWTPPHPRGGAKR